MGLTITRLNTTEAPAAKVRLDQRLYLAKDAETLVPEGHELAAFLFCIPGRPFLASNLEGKTFHDDCGKVKTEAVDLVAEQEAAAEAAAEADTKTGEQNAKDAADATANAVKSNAESPAGEAAAAAADSGDGSSADPDPPEFPKAAVNETTGKKRSGHWELSNGEIFKGNKAAAVDAEAEVEPAGDPAAENSNSDEAGGE